MTKRLCILATLVVFAFACVPQMHAAVATELVISDSFGDMVTIDVSNLGVLSVTCNSGSCGNVAANTVADGAHGTINITHATFGTGANTFTLSDTGVGGADNTLPTLQNLDQINANSNSGGGTLTATFTDTLYPSLSSTLNIADSNTTDVGISASTIKFTVSTSSTNAIPAGSQVYTNTLTGHTDDNGPSGVNVLNPNSSGSLTSMVVMTFTGTGSIQANITTSNVAVPEPAGTVLLGSVLVGLAAFVRRKQAKLV